MATSVATLSNHFRSKLLKWLASSHQIEMLADQVPEEHGGAVHDQHGGSHQLHTMKVSSAWTLPNYFRFK